LNVLLLNEFFHPENQGGTATAAASIARSLKDDHGQNVTVITGLYGYRDPNLRFESFEDWQGVKIYRTGNPNWGRARASTRLLGNVGYAAQVAWRALRLPKPDVVLLTTAPMTLPIAARILLRLRRVPYVYLIYDLDPNRTVALNLAAPDSRGVKILRKWQGSWLGTAARVVAIGRCMKELLVADYAISPDKIDVVAVGADPDVIRPLGRDTEFRRREQIEGFVVLYAGNFGQYHDFDTLLNAADRLRDVRPEITFVLVGGGKKRTYVEQQVASRGLTNVRLFDFVPEEMLSDLLASADLNVVTLEPGMEGICVPSKFYGYLAAGRPILALMAPQGEVARVVEESGIGFRVDIGDVDGLVAALTDSVASGGSATHEQMGVKARQLFDEHYTVKKTVGKLMKSLQAAADSR
jgi:glycosyltransferase involved in cell wall biosynthesis